MKDDLTAKMHLNGALLVVKFEDPCTFQWSEELMLQLQMLCEKIGIPSLFSKLKEMDPKIFDIMYGDTMDEQLCIANFSNYDTAHGFIDSAYRSWRFLEILKYFNQAHDEPKDLMWLIAYIFYHWETDIPYQETNETSMSIFMEREYDKQHWPIEFIVRGVVGDGKMMFNLIQAFWEKLKKKND
jgi:hypothetical protein